MNSPFILTNLRRAALALLVGSALVLAACGGGSDGGTAEAVAASPAPAADTPAATPEPVPAPAPAPAPGPGPAPAPGTTTPAPGSAAPSTAAATAVGTATGSASSATIGAAGGSLKALDGKLTLTIPAGALAADTVISIQPYTNTAHGKRGSAYRLAPEGQTFLKPVTLTFGYTDQDAQGTAVEALGAAFQTATGHWQWAGAATVDTAAKTVSVASTHFSVWSQVSGIQLVPASKTVRVSTSVPLQVVFCYQQERDGLASLGSLCDSGGEETAPLQQARDWSVNGRPGGGAFGTVSGGGLTANYTAPQFAPTPNTVAVSARVDWGARGAMLLVSNITVVEDDSWTGTASWKDEFYDVTAQITWTLSFREGTVAVYGATGIGTIAKEETYLGSGGTCTIPPTSGALNNSAVLYVDFGNTPPTYSGFGGVGTWPVTETCRLTDGQVITKTEPTAQPVFGGTKGGADGVEAAGTVSVIPATPSAPADMVIEGTDTGFGGVFRWRFTRNP